MTETAEVLEDFENEDQVEEESQNRALLTPIARVSSLLFVASKPVSAEKISRAAKVRINKVEEALYQLQELYQDDVHGFSLHEVAGGWQFRTAPEAAEYIRTLIPKKVKRLSPAAAETLAIIAYKQPVERSEIESIRGVDALPTLKTLLDAKLVRIVGTQDAVGQPALYGTTTVFLEKFGLRDLSELPSIHELEKLLADPGEAESKDSEEEAEEASETEE